MKKIKKQIEDYLASIIAKLQISSKNKKLINSLFIINFLTTKLINDFKNISFFKDYSEETIFNLIEINKSSDNQTFEIDYSKIIYAIDSLYSISEIKYTTDDSVLIGKLTDLYIEDVKKAIKFCKASFEKTGEKLIVF
jgi:hypothetical protein